MISVQNHLQRLSGNKAHIVTFLLLFCALGLWSQNVTVNKNGASFYVDTVEAGETLFAFKTKYKVSVEQIKRANNLSSNDLSLGQVIYVPILAANGSPIFLKPHVVDKSETLYGLSRKYDVEIDDILKFNPSVKEEGLKKGAIVKIPQPAVITNDQQINDNQNTITTEDTLVEDDTLKEVTKDSLIRHVVMQGETLYRISKRFKVSIDTIKKVNDLSDGFKAGDTILVPIKVVYERPILTDFPFLPEGYEDTVYFKPERKDRYNIIILLPLNLSSNGNIYKGLINRETFVDNSTYSALDFYMGMKLAMDSLRKAGLNLNVTLIDTRSDSTTVMNALEKAKEEGLDIIFGPVSSKCVYGAAAFAKENQIPIVLPIAAPNKVLDDNPFVVKAVTSKLYMLDAMTNYLVDNYHHANVMLMNSTSAKDKFPYDRFVKMYNDSIAKYPNAFRNQLKTINLGSSSGRDIIRHVLKDTVNIIVAPSVDLGFCTNLLTRMNKVKNSYDHKDTKLMVFGLDDYKDFHTINTSYKNKSLLHFPLPYYVEPNDPKYQKLICSFRKIFETDPGEMGVHGFDIGYFFLRGLLVQGTGFFLHPVSEDVELVQNRMELERVKPGSGIENNGYFIVKHEDYQLKKVYPKNE